MNQIRQERMKIFFISKQSLQRSGCECDDPVDMLMGRTFALARKCPGSEGKSNITSIQKLMNNKKHLAENNSFLRKDVSSATQHRFHSESSIYIWHDSIRNYFCD